MAREGYVNVARGSEREIKAREAILELFKDTPIPDDEILVNLGAYLRSTQLAKILYLNELYQLIERVQPLQSPLVPVRDPDAIAPLREQARDVPADEARRPRDAADRHGQSSNLAG